MISWKIFRPGEPRRATQPPHSSPGSGSYYLLVKGFCPGASHGALPSHHGISKLIPAERDVNKQTIKHKQFLSLLQSAVFRLDQSFSACR